MYVGFSINCQLFTSDFNQDRNFSRTFTETANAISRKFIQTSALYSFKSPSDTLAPTAAGPLLDIGADDPSNPPTFQDEVPLP
jgi:hypothetical protein